MISKKKRKLDYSIRDECDVCFIFLILQLVHAHVFKVGKYRCSMLPSLSHLSVSVLKVTTSGF